MSLKVFMAGMNGFIGNRLTKTILSKTDWELFGLDLHSDNLEDCKRYSRLHFKQGDITAEKKWIDEHLQKCDVVIPLVAIANPAIYVKDPLRVFELDFEANLEIVKKCHQYKKRLIFPSTSEVYGMCDEPEFNEETSRLILGPVQKERWIYSCSKQLLDRVIYAYGKHKGLQFTLFRPFNWIGPNQDKVFEEGYEHSRVVSKFLSNIVRGKNIELVDGGHQRRSFTYIDDGIDALMKIIENRDNCADSRIFNIGNPKNDVSIRQLAEMILELAKEYPKYADNAKKIEIVSTSANEYYGQGYQDVQARVPSIKNAEKYLGWHPKTDLKIALNNTLDYYLI